VPERAADRPLGVVIAADRRVGIRMGRVSRLLVRLFARPPAEMDWRYGVANHTVRRTFGVGQGDAVASDAPGPEGPAGQSRSG